MRYFFDFDDCAMAGYEAGIVLANDDQAKEEGRKALAEIAKKKIGRGANRATLTVQSEAGEIVFRAEMAVFESTPGVASRKLRLSA